MNIVLRYGANGQLASKCGVMHLQLCDPTTSSGTVVTTYGYNGQLPASETWSGTVSGAVSRTYDNALRAVSHSITRGATTSTVTLGYDADDLLVSAGSLTLSRSGSTGLITGSTLASIHDTLTANSFGEIDDYAAYYGSGTTNLLFREQVTGRDDVGRITAKTEVVGSTSHTYAYDFDAAGRLTDVSRDSSAIAHYEYDSNGNRIPLAGGHTQSTITQVSGELVDAAYDDQDRLRGTEYASGVETLYSYSANGELMSKSVSIDETTEVTSYAYDVLGNLREVTLDATGTPVVIEYVIDGNNRRVGKKVGGSLAQAWLYDGQLRIVAEVDGDGVLVSRFVYAAKANVPDYVIQGGTTYRIISDHLGSVRLVVNASTGAAVQEIAYDEFGNVLTDVVASGFAPVPFGFAGGLYDRATGLVRFGARDYDAETGRWTAKDPIGFEGGDSNLYGYVSNDPINDFDPTGLTTYGETSAATTLNSTLTRQFAPRTFELVKKAGCYALEETAMAAFKDVAYIGLLGGTGGGVYIGSTIQTLTGRFGPALQRHHRKFEHFLGIISPGNTGLSVRDIERSVQNLYIEMFGGGARLGNPPLAPGRRGSGRPFKLC